ncbi:MAG TPA: hypothetical protein DCM28_00475 [Phycisphaerales bacterium]|nr:hypothetical protein [Phycisphaerales bacterium]|tara:strand:- start:6257 stop:6721 length:465 start_codon:yes stop_codon:yes gene_type:complete
MILRDKQNIEAPASVIWEFLKDPGMMMYWNPKCDTCESDEDQVRVGLTYSATFSMGSRPQKVTCTVIACEPDRQLKIRYSGLIDKPNSYVDETFFLEPLSADRTHIRHHVNLTHSGLPWIIRVIAKIIDTLGTKKGNSSLDAISDLVHDLDKSK